MGVDNTEKSMSTVSTNYPHNNKSKHTSPNPPTMSNNLPMDNSHQSIHTQSHPCTSSECTTDLCSIPSGITKILSSPIVLRRPLEACTSSTQYGSPLETITTSEDGFETLGHYGPPPESDTTLISHTASAALTAQTGHTLPPLPPGTRRKSGLHRQASGAVRIGGSCGGKLGETCEPGTREATAEGQFESTASRDSLQKTHGGDLRRSGVENREDVGDTTEKRHSTERPSKSVIQVLRSVRQSWNRSSSASSHLHLWQPFRLLSRQNSTTRGTEKRKTDEGTKERERGGRGGPGRTHSAEETYQPVTTMIRRFLGRHTKGNGAHVIANYTIGKTIGRGGFSVVKEAIPFNRASLSVPQDLNGAADSPEPEKVMKIMRISKNALAEELGNSHRGRSSSEMELFSTVTPEEAEREVEIMRLCQHPNVIRLFEVFRKGHTIYTVLEKHDVELEKAGPMSWSIDKIRLVTAQLLLAVAHIHGKGICHRDLKPGNIFLSGSGENTRLVVSDFGLATPSTRNCHGISDTCGSLLALAPEVIYGDYGRKADLWSVGVCVYWMVYGTYPFQGGCDDAIARSILLGCPKLETTRSNGLPVTEHLRQLIRGLLESEPRQRLSAREALLQPFIFPPLRSIRWAASPLEGFRSKASAASRALGHRHSIDNPIL
eukprot:GHVQ01037999.1.p1 GENE.GHVQ01037999.1~~GHVQ01037999.1.p1  ORF type:complete len:661 (+),score=94.10 GHVQ01037999.1:919-2901(+)